MRDTQNDSLGSKGNVGHGGDVERGDEGHTEQRCGTWLDRGWDRQGGRGWEVRGELTTDAGGCDGWWERGDADGRVDDYGWDVTWYIAWYIAWYGWSANIDTHC